MHKFFNDNYFNRHYIILGLLRAVFSLIQIIFAKFTNIFIYILLYTEGEKCHYYTLYKSVTL